MCSPTRDIPGLGEADGVDYHFRSRDQIEALAADTARYVMLDVRGDLQVLDLNGLDALLAKGDAFFEGNPFVAHLLRDAWQCLRQ